MPHGPRDDTGLDPGEGVGVHGFNDVGGIWLPVPLLQKLGTGCFDWI